MFQLDETVAHRRSRPLSRPGIGADEAAEAEALGLSPVALGPDLGVSRKRTTQASSVEVNNDTVSADMVLSLLEEGCRETGGHSSVSFYCLRNLPSRPVQPSNKNLKP